MLTFSVEHIDNLKRAANEAKEGQDSITKGLAAFTKVAEESQVKALLDNNEAQLSAKVVFDRAMDEWLNDFAAVEKHYTNTLSALDNL